MKLNKCFTTVFDSALKERGFKRKGVLYYRINGEILQGITIKLINPYHICVGYIPYWMYDIARHFSRGCPLERNYWAEEFDYLDGDYYRQDDDQALEKMQSLLDPVINKLIPLLDKISSQDDYLRAKEYYLDLGSRLARPIIPEYALLQKALNDRSFAESDRILQKAIDYCIARELSRYDTREERQILIKRYDDSELDTFPDALKPYLQMVERLKQSEEEYAKELKKLDRMMEVHYANYIAIREKEDFDAIEALYNENLAKMKEEIKIKLKIDL